jgi:2-oxoglutarate ferredoxin oxidoreductase subunit beta
MSEGQRLSKKDFASDQEVRWCPGCGDYAILAAAQSVFAELGVPRERFVIVSGIGCSSRFPYYVNAFGFHTIHGRAPAVATGVKIVNPGLSVWVVTGDGDALSIGGNHIIHLFRRNLDVNVMLFDNRIYGLTKGQYSPTSEAGKKTKSTPFGSLERPFNPLALALGAGATFVARCIDGYTPHLKEALRAAHAHAGTSFVHVYQNCNIFNDGAFAMLRDKATRPDHVLELKQGEPLVFGRDRDRGIRASGCHRPEVVRLGRGVTESDLVVHDERGPLGYLMMLAEMQPPEFPVPIGVVRRVERPPFEREVERQIEGVTTEFGPGDLEALLHSGNTWTVR